MCLKTIINSYNIDKQKNIWLPVQNCRINSDDPLSMLKYLGT